MEIRKSTSADLSQILNIYTHARAFMAAHGNPHQWGDSWPPEELIRRDIADGDSYVCVEDGEIAATFFFRSPTEDPTYRKIYDGQWKSDAPYGVVHRIASSGKVKGTGSFCLDWAFAQCGHLRIDTHEDNQVMQNFLAKKGFVYCGIIYVREDNDPRLAYEKF